ncbi:hypothetical protein AN618_18850 [Fervidicola ferrireducens]|jgi:IMP cyclohydrolase|uniref:Uncharacterized protein n=1 Tax=Fervidicola ferrireducens TaxID=520764 RepID=A0A140L4N7_9FIRM|nr:hypothetical protein [Fervidicola ferrireducens]KXG75512.1 hypothetical protein AN618_18850 [Fervidicola ferrireducens]
MALEAVFEYEKETKNTVRFAEVIGENPAIVGTIYIQKFALNKLGNPKKIKITIEKAD